MTVCESTITNLSGRYNSKFKHKTWYSWMLSTQFFQEPCLVCLVTDVLKTDDAAIWCSFLQVIRMCLSLVWPQSGWSEIITKNKSNSILLSCTELFDPWEIFSNSFLIFPLSDRAPVSAPLPAAHGLPLLSARALLAEHAPEVHHDVRKCSETRYPQEGETI